MRHVIVGNGPAGVIAAEVLRSQCPGDEIVLIGDEPEPPYSRMAIPYLLAGDIGEHGTYLRKSPDHFSALRIRVLRDRVGSVHPPSRTVWLSNRRPLTYDRLLLATGSAPVVPPIPGIDSPGVVNCWTMADARKIQTAIKPGSRVLQLGAGFIGCIIMESIAERGAKLTVVEMGDRMVPRMMPPGASALIKSWSESKGVQVITGARVTRIDAQPDGLHVAMEGGPPMIVDVVISATGVRPQLGFLAGSGINTHIGILVDDRLQTNVEDVYAAGDCVETTEFGTGAMFVNAIQPDAADQARIAAMNMAGRVTRSPGSLAINVLDTFGLVSASFGQWQGVTGGDSVELNDPDRYRYLHLAFEGDVLVGATSLGLTEHVGVIRGLIQSRVKLGEWKARLMADPTQLMPAYLARAQDAA